MRVRDCLYVSFIIVIILLITCQFNYAQSPRLPIDQLAHARIPSTLIVKLKEPLSNPGKESLSNRLISTVPATSITEVRPTLPWTGRSVSQGKTFHPLSSIYTVKIQKDEDLASVLDELRQSPDVLYAEPYYLYSPLTIPNDPLINDQYYLELIRAFDAWSIEQGDSTVSVAILDTGIDLEHPELLKAIAYNYDDPINGMDDDGDGLVDNYYGWDMANNDNIPQADTDGHGTAVSGVAGARANNGLGVAGIAFQSKILPIKIFKSGTNAFQNGYEAIALAADLGCKVMNLSWGEENLYSAFGQDIINYAVLEKDVAIVAAAGNTNASLDFYPASFDNVLSIAASDRNDLKAPWATYSPFVDLIAPGDKITTTFNDEEYITTSGSSVATPMVAGALALIRSRFPNLTARQAMERVRINTDNIYENSGNQPYSYMLGHGRLNLYAALTNITSPAIRINSFSYTNGHEIAAYHNDTIRCEIFYENLLYPASGVKVTVSSPSPYVTILSPVTSLPNLGSLERTAKKQVVQLVLAPETPPDHRILLRFNYDSELYHDFEFKYFRTSPGWYTLNNGKIALTTAGNGNLGYERDLKKNGVGMTFENEQIASNLGVLFKSQNIIMDNIPYNQGLHVRQNDFTERDLLRVQHNAIADQYVHSRFAPPKLNVPTLPLEIEQEIFSWNNEGAVILEYYVTNTSDSILHDFQPAFLADFDLQSAQLNRATREIATNFLLQENNTHNRFAGIAVADTTGGYLLAVDKKNFNGNTADIPVVLTDESKRILFSPEQIPANAGLEGNGNDVALVTGLSKRELGPAESVRFTVILAAGSTRDAVETAIRDARQHYNALLISPPVLFTAEHCPSVPAIITLPGESPRIYGDPYGNDFLFEGNIYTEENRDELYVSLQTDGIYSDIVRIPVRERGVTPDFEISESPFLLDERGKTLVRFTDKSKKAVSWDWDFSNGYHSSSQNPAINFTETGNYTVTLTAINDLGCKDSTSRSLEVARRNSQPEDLELTGCAGSDFTYTSLETSSLRIYRDPELLSLVDEGEEFSVSGALRDTTFFITNVEGEYESLPARFHIDITEINTEFSILQDTTDLSQPYKLLLSIDKPEEIDYDWFIKKASSPVTQSLGMGPVTSFVYSPEAFDVTLYATHNSGCQSTETRTIQPLVSPTPVLPSSLQVCYGENIRVEPEGGTNFQFYSDEQLTDLIYKGRAFPISQLEKDTTVYVVSVDNMLPGNAARLDIATEKVTADFSLPVGLLDLNTALNWVITDASSGSSTRSWFINGLLSGNNEDLIFQPLESGIYNIRLEVSNDLGCSDFKESGLQVVRITGNEDLLPKISVFPNPTSGNVSFSVVPDRLEVIAPDGKRIVYECQSCDSVNLQDYSAGIYYLRLLYKGEYHLYKVIRN